MKTNSGNDQILDNESNNDNVSLDTENMDTLKDFEIYQDKLYKDNEAEELNNEVEELNNDNEVEELNDKSPIVVVKKN